MQTGIPADFEDIRAGITLQSRYYPVQDENGTLIGVAIFAQDITERKRAEEELRQNMQDLERFSKLAVGREERMIELKKEINDLILRTGQPDKYKIVA
jgi:PAS domain-containing protein